MKQIELKQIAYARSGDKGRNANVGLIAYTADGFRFLQQQLTADRVATFFDVLPVTRVLRYELPNLGALNFVLEGALGKGGSQSLAIDAQGKALGQALLTMSLEISEQELSASIDPKVGPS